MVSVLFNEPKLLKFPLSSRRRFCRKSFSALQRAEIAEIFPHQNGAPAFGARFSALQRAEIAEIGRSRARPKSLNMQVSVLFNEPKLLKYIHLRCNSISLRVSVLFNEPKLLKSVGVRVAVGVRVSFSALQRAEIAEIIRRLTSG